MYFFGVFSPTRLSKHHKTALTSQFSASLLLMMIFVVLVLVFNRHGVSHGVGQGMLLMSVGGSVRSGSGLSPEGANFSSLLESIF